MDYTSFSLTMRYIEDNNILTFDELIYSLWWHAEMMGRDEKRDGFSKKQIMDILAYVTGDGCAVMSSYFISPKLASIDTTFGHYVYDEEY